MVMALLSVFGLPCRRVSFGRSLVVRLRFRSRVGVVRFRLLLPRVTRSLYMSFFLLGMTLLWFVTFRFRFKFRVRLYRLLGVGLKRTRSRTLVRVVLVPSRVLTPTSLPLRLPLFVFRSVRKRLVRLSILWRLTILLRKIPFILLCSICRLRRCLTCRR